MYERCYSYVEHFGFAELHFVPQLFTFFVHRSFSKAGLSLVFYTPHLVSIVLRCSFCPEKKYKQEKAHLAPLEVKYRSKNKDPHFIPESKSNVT
jgi:hypothetical protein